MRKRKLLQRHIKRVGNIIYVEHWKKSPLFIDDRREPVLDVDELYFESGEDLFGFFDQDDDHFTR